MSDLVWKVQGAFALTSYAFGIWLLKRTTVHDGFKCNENIPQICTAEPKDNKDYISNYLMLLLIGSFGKCACIKYYIYSLFSWVIDWLIFIIKYKIRLSRYDFQKSTSNTLIINFKYFNHFYIIQYLFIIGAQICSQILRMVVNFINNKNSKLTVNTTLPSKTRILMILMLTSLVFSSFIFN